MSSHWHSQIQPDAPRPSLSPLDTLTHKVTDSHSTWDDHMPKIMGISAGFLCALYHNYVRVKPPFANIPRYIFYMGASTAFFEVSQRFRIYRQAEAEAVAREYIELHPEDFPPYDRKKFKDLFMEWVPIR